MPHLYQQNRAYVRSKHLLLFASIIFIVAQIHSAAIAQTAACPQFSFGAPQSYSSAGNTYPRWVQFGDLNNDQKLDLILANEGSDNITTWIGDGAGNFSIHGNYALGSHPFLGELGDVTCDGNLDLIIANAISENVSVLAGDGMGGFLPQQLLPVGPFATSAAIGDINLDGKLDVAAANDYSDTVSILTNNGCGSFDPKVDHTVGDAPIYVTIRDMNSDGNPDLVTTSAISNDVVILFGDGTGNFGNACSLPVAGLSPEHLTVDDYDGDGDLDIAIAVSYSDCIQIFRRTGSGNCQYLSHQIINVGDGPFSICAGDLDSDGKLDLAATNTGSDTISLLPGNGDATFGAPQDVVAHASPIFIDMGHVNGDGKLDIVTANINSHDATVFMNQTVASTAFVNYGVGTPGCSGPHLMGANKCPKINTPDFVLTCINAPNNSLGLCLISDQPDLAGLPNSFGLGFILHVDLITATEFIALDIVSNDTGTGFGPAPIPDNASLIGNTYYAQAIWVWVEGPTCAAPPFGNWNPPYGLSSSDGLAITIQP